MALANGHLGDGLVYVTGIKVSADNHISVLIDGDRGVSIKDCVDLSRAIEGQLDREKEDFALDVSSHGASSPLLLPRQYTKHVGRDLEIKLIDGTKTGGCLTAFDGNTLVLEQTVRENKPVGKGKMTVVKQQQITIDKIKEAKVKLKY
jgi:ribosome maturation factor RimP